MLQNALLVGEDGGEGWEHDSEMERSQAWVIEKLMWPDMTKSDDHRWKTNAYIDGILDGGDELELSDCTHRSILDPPIPDTERITHHQTLANERWLEIEKIDLNSIFFQKQKEN